jgi:serine/threonine-protein kinase HipA
MNRLEVRLHIAAEEEIPVGTLVLRDRDVLFQYVEPFLDRALDLSPYHLPRQRGVQVYDGQGRMELFGVFEDAMPDSWGRRLLDTHFQHLHGRSPSALERLACVGTRGMGALTFHPPEEKEETGFDDIRLETLGENVWRFDEEELEEALPELRRLGGSSGGARPKALIGLPREETPVGSMIPGDGDLPSTHAHWLVKFNSRSDVKEAGPLEFAYAQMACAAGADMPEHRLLPTRIGSFFAARRFDRPAPGQRLHLHSAAGLLHADFRTSGQEAELLFRLTQALTRDYSQKRELFRRICLNVLASNRDDHLKNFAFLMDAQGTWRLSPLYDFTYNPGPNGWHTLSIAGEGQHPRRAHLLKLAEQADLRERDAREILDQVRAAVADFGTLAKEAGVANHSIQRLRRVFTELEG